MTESRKFKIVPSKMIITLLMVASMVLMARAARALVKIIKLKRLLQQ